jgi:hypothetical protein
MIKMASPAGKAETLSSARPFTHWEAVEVEVEQTQPELLARFVSAATGQPQQTLAVAAVPRRLWVTALLGPSPLLALVGVAAQLLLPLQT